LNGRFGEGCGDDNWQADVPVGDTGRVFHEVATPAPPRPVGSIRFREICSAQLANSTSVLILHNPPSGDPVPSPEDIALARRLAAAGVLIRIDVIDRVVLGDVRHSSFKEAGRL